MSPEWFLWYIFQNQMTKDKMVAYLGRIGPRTSTHHWRRFDLNVTYFKTKSKQQKQKTEKKLADEDMTLEPPTFEAAGDFA